MSHFHPLGIAQLVQFALVAVSAVGLVLSLTRRSPGRNWLLPLTLAVMLIPFGFADWWINRGLGDPRIRGVEGMDNDYIGVSVHYILLISAAVISLVWVGLAVRSRHLGRAGSSAGAG